MTLGSNSKHTFLSKVIQPSIGMGSFVAENMHNLLSLRTHTDELPYWTVGEGNLQVIGVGS